MDDNSEETEESCHESQRSGSLEKELLAMVKEQGSGGAECLKPQRNLEKLSGGMHQLSTDLSEFMIETNNSKLLLKKKEIEMSQYRLAKIHAVMFDTSHQIVKEELRDELLSALAECRK